jgi:hypothetical protein
MLRAPASPAMSTMSRLERAMELFLELQERGVARAEAIALHPDLAELLELLYAGDDEVPAAGSSAPVATASREPSEVGPFRLVRPLGAGGAGVVYEAHQSTLGRRVALKVLAVGSAATPTQIARFRREALTLARLNHPNVVRVLDAGSEHDRHWLAMDLVEGRSLAERLDELRDPGPGASRQAPLRRCSKASRRSRTRSSTRTAPASSTATSSRRTSSCTATAACCCRTSGSRATSPRRA